MVLDLDSNNFTSIYLASLWNSMKMMKFFVMNNVLEGLFHGKIGNVVASERLVLSNNMLKGLEI